MSTINKMHEFYEDCKKLNMDNITEYIKQAKSEEEKRFYLALVTFFMQERQEKIIKEEFTI